jgi:hypothetical protein
MAFFIISIAVSGPGIKAQAAGYKVPQQEGPSATTPEDSRWERGDGSKNSHRFQVAGLKIGKRKS